MDNLQELPISPFDDIAIARVTRVHHSDRLHESWAELEVEINLYDCTQPTPEPHPVHSLKRGPRFQLPWKKEAEDLKEGDFVALIHAYAGYFTWFCTSRARTRLRGHAISDWLRQLPEDQRVVI